MRMVILLGRIYMTANDGIYIPVTFTAVIGGMVMTQGEPMTWKQVTSQMIESLLQDPSDITDVKGAALVKQWEEEQGRDE